MRWRAGIAAFYLAAAVVAMAADEEDLSLWDFSLSAAAGVGYKDNILLSDFNMESSVYTLTTADFFLFRLPVDGWELSLLGSGEDRRYWQSSGVEKEQLFLSSLEVKKTLGEIWTPGLNLLYVYNDQVFDASIQEGLPYRVQARLHRFTGGPQLFIELPRKFRVETKFEITRQEFQAPLDDSWEVGPKTLFGKKYGNKSDLTVFFSWRERAYDNLRTPGLGKGLRYTIREVEAGNRHYFDEERNWSLRSKIGLEWIRDNGIASNDYRRWRGKSKVTYARGGFEGSLEAGLLHYQYDVQTGLDGRVRQRNELTLGMRLEQKVFKQARLFVEYEHEWVTARDVTERYRANTIWSGILWDIK